jgi:superfamily II DNA helicase RecQ
MYSIEEGIQHGLDKLGYQSLRDGQQEVIEAYLKGKDVFFCSPTGSGKSLCY